MFIYLDTLPISDGKILFSPDGEEFFAVAMVGFSGGAEVHDLSFVNPHDGLRRRQLQLHNGVITYKGVAFIKQEGVVDVPAFVPLPSLRVVEHFCQADDGTFIYVSSDKYHSTYRGFRLFIGDGATMRQVPIKEVQRLRGGGATRIFTPEGLFYSPSLFSKLSPRPETPSWNSQPLDSVNPDDYAIVENDETLTITKK